MNRTFNTIALLSLTALLSMTTTACGALAEGRDFVGFWAGNAEYSAADKTYEVKHAVVEISDGEEGLIVTFENMLGDGLVCSVPAKIDGDSIEIDDEFCFSGSDGLSLVIDGDGDLQKDGSALDIKLSFELIEGGNTAIVGDAVFDLELM